MRRLLIAAFIAAGAALGLVTGGSASLAYWSTGAQTAVTLSPASIGLATTPISSLALNGASGVTLASIDFTNSGAASLSSATFSTTSAPVAPTVPGFTLSVSHAIVAATTACSAVSAWSPVTAALAYSAPMPVGASARVCVRFEHSGANSSMNGASAMVTVSGTGRVGSNWATQPASAWLYGTVQNAPSPEPNPVPLATCTPAGQYLVHISYAGAPAGTYSYTIGSPDALPRYGSTDSAGLAQGFAISFSQFNAPGTQDFYLVDQTTGTAVAHASVVNDSWQSITCGVL